MKNVTDISACHRLPDVELTQGIGRAARQVVFGTYGWDERVAQLRPVAHTEWAG